MPGHKYYENGNSSTCSHTLKFKKRNSNPFGSSPANCGSAPSLIAARSDATHLNPNAASESALGYSATSFVNSSSNTKRSKVDLSGMIPENHSLFATGINGRENVLALAAVPLRSVPAVNVKWNPGKSVLSHDKDVLALPAVPLRSVPAINVKWNPGNAVLSHDKDDEGHKLANTSDNTAHKRDLLWNQESVKIEAILAEAQEFINLLNSKDSKDSKPNTYPVVDDFLIGSKESKDQLPSFDSDALHPCTTIGEQNLKMEADKRGRDQILANSDVLQNLEKSHSGEGIRDNTRISVAVQDEKASGTETFSEDDEDDFSILSPAEWNALQLHFHNKHECTEPSMGKLEKKLERQSSLKFVVECGDDAIEPQGINIVDSIDPISVGTTSDHPTERFLDWELTETKCREHQSHGSTDLIETSTIAERGQDKQLKTFSADDGAVARYSCKIPNAANSYKELINWEIVNHDQPQGRKVMQALKLFEDEYVKIMLNHELQQSEDKTMFPHIKAGARVMEKGMGFSKHNKIFGHIPGIEIGDEFSFRVELVIVGLHCQLQAGIDSVELDGKRYATSVVNSGAYENTTTTDGTLIYSGVGGNPKVSNSVVEDQKLVKGNLALSNSMIMKFPVRVIHRRKCPMTSKSLSRTSKSNLMYVYDGLYMVENFWQERDDQTHRLVYKFKLQRLPGQQPLCYGANVILENQIQVDVKLGKQTQVQVGVRVLDDVSQGKEIFPVRVFNAFDGDQPPPFNYITKIVYPHWYQRVDPIGCNCIDGCSDSVQCSCVLKNGGEIPFNEKGAICRAKPNNAVHECGPSCKCPPSCMNRVSQHGPRYHLEIFKTESMGWGVRSRDFISQGSFICEYVGELLGEKEAEQRIGNDEYLFNVFQSHDGSDGFALDAREFGNVGRFINHSCQPNLFSQKIVYDNDDKRVPRIMFFAGKGIPPRQELTYDYNYKPDRVRDENGNIKKKACHCGARKCTGRLY